MPILTYHIPAQQVTVRELYNHVLELQAILSCQPAGVLVYASQKGNTSPLVFHYMAELRTGAREHPDHKIVFPHDMATQGSAANKIHLTGKHVRATLDWCTNEREVHRGRAWCELTLGTLGLVGITELSEYLSLSTHAQDVVTHYTWLVPTTLATVLIVHGWSLLRQAHRAFLRLQVSTTQTDQETAHTLESKLHTKGFVKIR